VLSVGSVQNGYEDVFGGRSRVAEKKRVEFETPDCRDMGLELNRVGSCKITARRELDWEWKTTYAV
jgi:hypothetical protein